MGITIVIILTLIIAETVCSIPTVYVKNGVLTIMHAMNCTIMLNKDLDNILHINTNGNIYEHKTLLFGLVDYDCDGYVGSMISDFDCKDCGIYCSYNQHIEKCKNDIPIIVVGTILTTAILTIILVLFRTKLCLFSTWIIDLFLINYHKRAAQRDYKLARKMIKVDPNVNLQVRKKKLQDKYGPYVEEKVAETVDELNDRINAKVYSLRRQPEYIEMPQLCEPATSNQSKEKSCIVEIDMHQTQPSHNPDYNTTTKMSDVKATAPMLYPDLPRRNSRSSSTGSMAKVLCASLLLSGNIPYSEGCDNNLFINSMGQVCDQMSCKDIDMYTMPIQTGQSICFKDTNNDDFSIKILRSSIISRYIPIYYTSDWSIETNSYYVCKGAGECWSGACDYETKGIKYKASAIADNGTNIYGCLTSALGCDTTCWHQLSCTYFHWRVVPKGDLITVYKVENSLWQVMIQLNYKNATKTAMLNVNNPSIGLEEFKDILGTNIPLYVTNFMSESIHVEQNVVQSKNGIIPMTASELNMPESDKIGDYQISLDHITNSFNYNSVECKVESCKVKCISPLPKVRKLPVLSNNYKDNSIVYKNNGGLSIITSEKRVMSTITIMIGNLKLKNLQVEPAYCRININTIYGCKGCNKLPVVIYTPMSIKVEGAMYFESNCSFEKDYFSCNNGHNIIKATEKYTNCLIFIPKTNQTIEMSFEYEFLGSVEPNMYSVSQNSLKDELADIAMNPVFWQSILSTFTMFTGISILLSLTIRAFKVYQLKKVHDGK